MHKLKYIYNRNKTILNNFSYITILQIFLILVPLITYPYLIRVLGSELYGYVITAQVVASYCSILVDFGFKKISAKHISIHRDNINELSLIMSSIFTIRFFLWIISFSIYFFIIMWVDNYHRHVLLFLFSFGLTFNELLFPQFFFQGMEEMKVITILNVIIRLIFIILVFIFIKDKADYIFVPLFMSLGYFLFGIVSIIIIVKKYGLRFIKPSFENLIFYTKDTLPVFSTDIIATIKDKLNYLVVAQFIGVSEVVIYDLGAKFSSLAISPSVILNTVLFPKISREKNISFLKKGLLISISLTSLTVLCIFILLPYIVPLFINYEIDLLPIRIFLLVPIILSISSFISYNLIIGFGYNKYILYSIIVTTIGYLFAMAIIYYNNLNSVIWVVWVAVFSYMIELIYRLFVSKKILRKVGRNG